MTVHTETEDGSVENALMSEPMLEDKSKCERKYGTSFLMYFASFTGNSSFLISASFSLDKLQIQLQ